MCGMRYSPSRVLVGQHLRWCSARVHRRVPAHVGHVQEQRVDRIGIAAPRRCGSPCASGRARRAAPPRNRPCRCGSGVPSASTSRSSRRRRTKPSGGPAQRRHRRDSSGLPAGLTAGGAGCGKGRLVAEAARAHRSCRAASAARGWRGRCGSRWNGPRCRASHAWRPAGRPSSSWRRPAQSVHGTSSSIACSKAACGELGGDAPDGVGGNAAALRRRASGDVCGVEIALGHAAGTTGTARRPSGRVNSPIERRRDVGSAARRTARPLRLVPAPAAGRRRRARTARHRRRPGCAITSHGALV